MEFDSVPVHLVKEGGQQLTDDYRGKNPMAEVPTLVQTLAFDQAARRPPTHRRLGVGRDQEAALGVGFLILILYMICI